ncbi:MAG TPA: glycosyltransferase family 2 protein [Burkholderiaceae bacterium]|nr:glycosyltransferase family 2 protein [Burkholderiaceae bacterium]
MAILAHLILLAIALPGALSCLYLLLLTLLSARAPVPPRSSRSLRFDIVVPAHNEAAGIQRTVESLRRVDWPTDRFRVRVVADNCTDATAELARAAGADVLERNNPLKRGKGYALDFAFRAGATDSWAQAVVVIDADAVVSANLLEACATRIERGAQAVQVHYGVSNPDANWRTRLITIAKSCFHIVRSRARERLGLSCGVRGNGWCVTYDLLRRVPYACFSLTEDLEYGIELGLAGVRVEYADEACANADMVSDGKAAGTQRQRWEDGRFQMIRARTASLLQAALSRRSAVCLDLALDLLVLPLSYVVIGVAALLAVSELATMWRPELSPWVALGWICVAALVAYVLRGWQLSGVGLRGLLDFARVPGYIAWKTMIMLRRRTGGWVRTRRES